MVVFSLDLLGSNPLYQTFYNHSSQLCVVLFISRSQGTAQRKVVSSSPFCRWRIRGTELQSSRAPGPKQVIQEPKSVPEQKNKKPTLRCSESKSKSVSTRLPCLGADPSRCFTTPRAAILSRVPQHPGVP